MYWLNHQALSEATACLTQGAAQAMIEAVLGKGVLRQRNLSLQTLMDTTNHVTALLGRTISVRKSRADDFRKSINEYCDSTNRSAHWPRLVLGMDFELESRSAGTKW